MKKGIKKMIMIISAVFLIIIPTEKANAAWTEYGTWIDDVTGQQAINCWVQDGENIYFAKSDGYILTSSWLYDPFGNWYLTLEDGKIARFLFVRIPKMEQYYDISLGQFVMCENQAGWYYFDNNGICTEYPEDIEGNVPLYEIKEEEQIEDSTEEEVEVQKFSNEELEMVARNYLPNYVTYATLEYIMPILGGCNVYFNTEYGEIEVCLMRDYFGYLLDKDKEAINSITCHSVKFK